MIRIFDMSTGKIIEDEFGRFEDEVLNAEWLPPQPDLQLGLQEHAHAKPVAQNVDADSYLANIYRSQE